MRVVLTSLLLMTLAGSSPAAPPRPGDFGTPVDQAVADLDGLSTSLRRVQLGLRLDGEQTSLFARYEPLVAPNYDKAHWAGDSQGARRLVYYRVGPGFRARMDRLNYLSRTGPDSVAVNASPAVDGQFLELAPANLIYELRPVPLGPVQPAPPTTHTTADGRINGQINGAVDGRVEARLEARVLDPR